MEQANAIDVATKAVATLLEGAIANERDAATRRAFEAGAALVIKNAMDERTLIPIKEVIEREARLVAMLSGAAGDTAFSSDFASPDGAA